MLNFTVGPVQINEEIRDLSREQIPYFRTPEFSAIMLENERLIKKFFKASDSAKVVFLTGSGTSAMESSIMNTLDSTDKVLVVNGGSFGERFVEICSIHELDYTEIKLPFGKNLTAESLNAYDHKGYTAMLVNVHETSTGVLYDINMISDFCKRNHIFLIVDAISSFLADPFDMEKLGVDIVFTGSQKALALAPGIAVMVLSEQAVSRIKSKKIKSLYFDLKLYLEDGKRGQTPFTPAVGILLQLNQRLRMIDSAGVESENEKIRRLAEDFRDKIRPFPFKFFSERMSNAVTSLTPTGNISAYKIFEIMKDEYSIFVCPNGGTLKDTVFRVGHIGDLTTRDNDTLIAAFADMKKRGII